MRWIEALLAAGVDIIQVGSFVHPEKVPQMADTDALFRHSRRGQEPRQRVLSGLVLNEKGLERGLACGVEMFCMGVSASETHSRKNTGMSTAEATRRIIADGASRRVAAGKKVQVSVQSAFGCGFEGPVPRSACSTSCSAYLDAGLRSISLADTAGHAHPAQVEQLFGAILALDPDVECTCHFHNTYGLGMANCYAALRARRDLVRDRRSAGWAAARSPRWPAGNVGHRGPGPLPAAHGPAAGHRPGRS